MKYQIYIPLKTECLPDIKIILSRCKVPFFAQINNIDLIKRINNLYYHSFNIFEPKIYFNSFNLTENVENIIPQQFNKIAKFTIFIATLGEEFDQFISNFADKNEIFDAFIADAWGSEAVESVNRKFDKYIRSISGFKGTRRFSPGYMNIDIKMNKYIVENLFNLKSIKVYETGVMYPRKTTICLIGWYL